MEFKIANIKEPRMVELWAMVIIVCFNFAFLFSVVLEPCVLQIATFHYLLLWSQLFVFVVSVILLRRHLSRSYIEEYRDASIEQRKTLETVIKGQESLTKSIETQQKISQELLDRLMSLKNLPPI